MKAHGAYRKTLLSLLALVLGAGMLFSIETGPNPEFPDHTKAQIDLPGSQHMQNVGGSDGAGLCVYSAVTMGARWHNLPDIFGLRKFAEGRPGGSYPEKLDADLKTYATRNACVIPPYIQHTGGDDTFLTLVLATRRMPGITYAGADGFYEGAVAHMVNCAHLDKTRGAIIDNNRPGVWVTMTNTQLLNRWKGLDDNGKPLLIAMRQGLRIIHVPVGGGWCFVWLGPPPPPKALTVQEQISPPLTPDAKYVWEREILADEQAYWFLYSNGTLIFVVDPEGKWHLATGPDSWEIEPLGEAPVGYPPPAVQELTRDENNGVLFWRISPQHRFSINGVECTRGRAVAALLDPGEGGLVDDSDKYHLSLIADDTNAKVLSGWFLPGGPLERFTKRVHVQVYKASDWPAKDRLTTNVTLQEPAKVGGKIVGTATLSNLESVSKILSDTFDAPPPVKPDPKPVVPPKAPDDKPLGPNVPPVPAPAPIDSSGAWKLIAAIILLLSAVYVILQESKPVDASPTPETE